MGDPRTTPDVRFDFVAASDLAAKCRAAKLHVSALHGSRTVWVSSASEEFLGYFSLLFIENASYEGADASNLETCLEDVATKVERLAELARLENQARARAREWQARRDQMWDLEKGWNDFWGFDQRPTGTTGPAPSLDAAPPVLQQRQTPSTGQGSHDGTSSARPANLRSFAANYDGADSELDTILAGLRSADEAFQAGCGWGSLSTASVWSGFASYIAANREDARWATVIAAAFESAGGDSGLSTLSNTTLSMVLASTGLSESRQSVTIVPAQMQGIAPSSGFVDDPVNAATGNFIEPETDVAFFGGAVGLAWRRMYNSMSMVVGAFGIGWSSAADSHVEVGEDGEARWWMPDGRHRPAGRKARHHRRRRHIRRGRADLRPR